MAFLLNIGTYSVLGFPMKAEVPRPVSANDGWSTVIGHIRLLS